MKKKDFGLKIFKIYLNFELYLLISFLFVCYFRIHNIHPSGSICDSPANVAQLPICKKSVFTINHSLQLGSRSIMLRGV